MKFPIYRFVTCTGYYKKNKDLWKIDFYSKNTWDMVELRDCDGSENIIAHKGDYEGQLDIENKLNKSFTYKTSRPKYSEEYEFDSWCGETVHQNCYNYIDEPFEGFLVGVINLTTEFDFGPSFDDAVDTGLGIMPERYYIGKWNEKVVKVGKVYINKNNVFRYVPIDCIYPGG